jgi:hypothetical protein
MSDEILRRKEDYLADGRLWQREETDDISVMRRLFRRIQVGGKTDTNISPPCSELLKESHERFQERLKRIICHLFNLVTMRPFMKEVESLGNAPLSACFWLAFGELEADEVLDVLLPHFPDHV